MESSSILKLADAFERYFWSRQRQLPPISSSITIYGDMLIFRFRDAIGSGDYYSAVGHLHSYFDHTITMQTSSTDSTYYQSDLPNTPRNFYQFALLHLAILHEQFRNYSDATWVYTSTSTLTTAGYS